MCVNSECETRLLHFRLYHSQDSDPKKQHMHFIYRETPWPGNTKMAICLKKTSSLHQASWARFQKSIYQQRRSRLCPSGTKKLAMGPGGEPITGKKSDTHQVSRNLDAFCQMEKKSKSSRLSYYHIAGKIFIKSKVSFH